MKNSRLYPISYPICWGTRGKASGVTFTPPTRAGECQKVRFLGVSWDKKCLRVRGMQKNRTVGNKRAAPKDGPR